MKPATASCWSSTAWAKPQAGQEHHRGPGDQPVAAAAVAGHRLSLADARATSPEVKVDLTTALERNQVRMGESVRLNVTLSNKTAGGLLMTLARVGIPGGLSFRPGSLKSCAGRHRLYETQDPPGHPVPARMKPSETVNYLSIFLAT